MSVHSVKGFALVFAAFLGVLGLFGAAEANSLYQGSVGSSGVIATNLPGQALWTYYQTIQMGQICPPDVSGTELCNTSSDGDNIIRLVNPNGAANGNLSGAKEQTVCAMIYVFDDEEEMGECCGCPVSSAGLATFSVEKNLTSNWALAGGFDGPDVFDPTNGIGAIAIVAAAPNVISPTLCAGSSNACHGGCDPTNVPGYSVTLANNLLGSITHNQFVAGNPLDGQAHIGITEIRLSDDGPGDLNNLVYLENQCGALIGNSSGGGSCNCPTE